ncbi:MAG: hypothetical protein NTZ11_09920 [Gammaproteobacteria bacterium]|nr:hypothetical protein [Gammaproteobacteria bacterium]
MSQLQARLRTSSRTRPPAGVRPAHWRWHARGGSVVAPLIVVMTAALMATVSQFALLTPHEQIAQTLQALRLPMSDGAAPRAFGACGDVCSVAGGCRHVVLSGGLHDGSRVQQEVLQAAQACH